ncbi:YbdK family carboxylate-amine ligase [Chitinimonas lacunae]|uniref:Putative glutamate--cysteine ligase 2 n=1 Tax=Chitinimonas lacunae TaxID=1963018 RepID=A0ABV8MMG6_9NEIS
MTSHVSPLFAFPFRHSAPLTLGVELELMLVNRNDRDLAPRAQSLLDLTAAGPYHNQIVPEITQSMIELNSSVHQRIDTLAEELRLIGRHLVESANSLGIDLAGGGAHPFQRWQERLIFPGNRYRMLSDLYGYLAKRFTVFGQHIHIGCPDGDTAVYLIHQLGRFVPFLIVLTASSPFYQGVDTGFASARMNNVAAFPFAGHMPEVADWAGFEAYFHDMSRLGIVETMKDFYWDVRPKPEFGTVEVRICDTPLRISSAVTTTAFLQALVAWLLDERPPLDMTSLYRVYAYNRFQAARFGMEADIVDPMNARRENIGDALSDLLERLQPYAEVLGSTAQFDALRERVDQRDTDAEQLRRVYAESNDWMLLVAWQVEMLRAELDV